MKRPLILIFCALFFACSSESEPAEEVEKINKPPQAPALSMPEDNLFCVENELDFSWLPATDPEDDKIFYLFELSTTSDFAEIYYRKEISLLTINKEVVKGSNYYWRVMAKDDQGNNSAYSAIRNFYTEDAKSFNSLPSVPKLITPEEQSVTGLEVELAWESTDPDNDNLKYDLYFGTSENPGLLQENLTEKTHVVNNLAAGKTYYWKVVVKDEPGSKTIGQTWSFKTGS